MNVFFHSSVLYIYIYIPQLSPDNPPSEDHTAELGSFRRCHHWSSCEWYQPYWCSFKHIITTWRSWYVTVRRQRAPIEGSGEYLISYIHLFVANYSFVYLNKPEIQEAYNILVYHNKGIFLVALYALDLIYHFCTIFTLSWDILFCDISFTFLISTFENQEDGGDDKAQLKAHLNSSQAASLIANFICIHLKRLYQDPLMMVAVVFLLLMAYLVS